MLGFWVYMLLCGDGSYYVGHTDDLERRMAQHASGELGGYTAERHPLTLVFVEEFPTRDEAICRERQIKGWSRRKKEALVARDWPALQQFARTARQS
jgi:predicted GIY-YIG superfamily endonuclease